MLGDSAQPAELPDEVRAVLPDAAVAVQRDLPEPLTAQRRDPERAGRHRGAARRGLGRRQVTGIDEARVAGAPSTTGQP